MQTKIKVGGAILSALITALSYSFNIFNVIPDISWSSIALISFLIFVGIVFYGWSGAETKIKQLESARPSIKVEPKKIGDVWHLIVTNNGAPATLSAQITLQTKDINLLGLTNLPQYSGLWDTNERYEAKLKQGLSASIKIAEINVSQGIKEQNMKLFFCQTTRMPDYVSASSHGWMKLDPSTGIATPLQQYDHLLLVKISSDPSLKNGVFQRSYKLNYDGLTTI